MIFPNGIVGPRFDQGDLVTFVFDNAELIFRVPKVPTDSSSVDELSDLKNFQSVNTNNWSTNDQGFPCMRLSRQLWNYEDGRSFDNVAQTKLYVGIVEAPEEHRRANTFLFREGFESAMLAWNSYSFGERHSEKYLQDSSWPALQNRYHGRSISQKYLDWFVVQLSMSSDSNPVHLAMIPINNRFVLMVFIEIKSLHYSGRANPYSEEILKQFERDLFDDFLSHIKLEYSSELIATINSLKNNFPA